MGTQRKLLLIFPIIGLMKLCMRTQKFTPKNRGVTGKFKAPINFELRRKTSEVLRFFLFDKIKLNVHGVPVLRRDLQFDYLGGSKMLLTDKVRLYLVSLYFYVNSVKV